MNASLPGKMKNAGKQYLRLTPWMRTLTLNFVFSIVVIRRLGEGISQAQFT